MLAGVKVEAVGPDREVFSSHYIEKHCGRNGFESPMFDFH